MRGGMQGIKFYDIPQNEPEWFNLRAGKLTASNLSKVMANYGNAFKEPAKKLAVDIAVEKITSEPILSDYTNLHMQRGHEQEQEARLLYEQIMFCDVHPGGFFCNDNLGCSPDGLINDDGLIEIKSVIPSIHFANIKRKSIDPAYKWQVYSQLHWSGREWCEFVSYCANFPDDMKLYVFRVNKSDISEEIKMIDSRVQNFLKLVSDTKQTILNSNYFLR